MHTGWRWTVVLATGVAAAAMAASPPLNTDLTRYFIFSMRNADLKNIQVLGACNVGVNCKQPSSNSDCGVVTNEDVFYADGSQIQGDRAKFSKPGASVWQLFSNNVSGLPNLTVRHPGPGPGGSDPLAPLPILGDEDMDGNASCAQVGGQCVIDVGDLEAALGFPTPFPACDVLAPVIVKENLDCLGAPDAVPLNGKCDLPPGSYGDLDVQNDAILTFTGGGEYTFCIFRFGKSTTTTANVPVVINVNGDLNINNDAAFGQSCADITVRVNGPGKFGFGRGGVIMGRFWAPARTTFLGHDNDLTGQFFGDTVLADSNVRGHCCTLADDCACFDDFTPKVAMVGDEILLTGACDLTPVTGVTICGLPATIVLQTPTEVRVTVPVGAAGACALAATSSSGTYTANTPLTVN